MPKSSIRHSTLSVEVEVDDTVCRRRALLTMSVCQLQLSACRSEMSALQKDHDRLLDQATGTLSPDEVLQTTRTERDALSDRLQ